MQPDIFTENSFEKGTVKGKYNLAYSEKNVNAGKPYGQVLIAINTVSSRLYTALKALFVELGEYRELPNPITLNTSFSHTNRTLKMPRFTGLSASGTNAWGTSSGGGVTLTDNDIAIITDMQIRLHAMEQQLAGNFSSTQQNDLTGV